MTPSFPSFFARSKLLDGNVLGAIGFPISDHDPIGVTKRIVGSGVNVVKSTLGGPQGNFEEAVAAIANAELLMEKQPESFFKVRYNSAATGDTDAGVAVAIGSPDHKAPGLIATNVTAPPKVFVNCRRLIMSRERLPQSNR
jgi:hypothetical protein